MKVAIISNKTSDIIRSRGELIKAITQNGHEVIAIGNEDVGKEKIEKLGAKFRNINMNELSINIFKNINYISRLAKILKEEKIDIILVYSVKPIVCGSIAGKIANVKKIYALVVGMGYNYSINNFRTNTIRFFCDIGYRIACRLGTKFIFQNKEDRDELIRRKFLKMEKTEVVDGSGVNMDKFTKSENSIDNMNNLRFLMISRGLNVKGIKELSLAAEKIHNKYPGVKFTHIGKLDKSYRDITDKEIKEYSKWINFEGKVDNVKDYIKDSNVIILPSYLREGIPRVLLEGLAVGRPIITTNMRGCKETVIEGKNGYLVNVKDDQDLADKILKMIESSKEDIEKMSDFSYELAKKRFNVDIINKKMLKIMELNGKENERE